MSEEQVVAVGRRRSQAEAEQLVAEFEASGLSRREFCRQHGLALGTLDGCRKRKQMRQAREGAGGSRWVAVELSERQREVGSRAGSALAAVLRNGRRIEVGRGFDARTLEQLVRVLEQA